jgi:glycerophosphoryl diester phosphodiesterase
LVLFHDDTILRLTGAPGSIRDYTLEQLRQFTFENNGLMDKIVVFEEFLQQFGWRDLTFAIEIKQAGIESKVVDMIRKYGIEAKTIVTSFMLDSVRATKQYAPEQKVGFLTRHFDDALLAELKQIGAEQFCPEAPDVTAETVARWRAQGFEVRAWGVKDEILMRQVYDAGADGMTVNFPDKLTALIKTEGK